MKKIKSFEEFEMNEISQYLANRAGKAAGEEITNSYNNLTKNIKKDQRDNFYRYINPELKRKAEALGFYDLGRYMDNYYIKYTVNNTENYEINLDVNDINKLKVVYNGVDLATSNIPAFLARKINNLYNMISKNASITQPNEL